MSNFSALNLSPQDEELEAEEHTRELQVEEAFKLYEKALNDVKEGQFETAQETFDSLFTIDILKPNKWGFYAYSSPTLDSLRYLCYRNRGMFYYKYLCKNYKTMNDDIIVNYILKVIEDLVESIQHNEADNSVISLLVQIFKSFKSKKLERLILEYELAKADNVLPLSGRRSGGVIPQLTKSINQYLSLIGSLRDPKENIKNLGLPTIKKLFHNIQIDEDNSNDMDGVLKIINNMKKEDDRVMKQLDKFEVNIDCLTWETVLNGFKELVPHVKLYTLITRNVDPYNEMEDPIEAISFKLNLANEEDKQTKEESIMHIDDEDITVPSTQDNIRSNAELKTDLATSESQQVTLENPQNPIQELIIAEGDDIPEDKKDGILIVNESSSRKRSVSELTERPAQRTSKRFKHKESIETVSYNSMKEHEVFFDGLFFLSQSVKKELPFTLYDLEEKINQKDQADLNFLPFIDLFECLKNWTSAHTELFNKNEITTRNDSKESEDMTKLNNVLKSTIFSSQLGDSMIDVLEELPKEDIEGYLLELNSHEYHFHEIRLRLLLKFLHGTSVVDRPITQYNWSPNFFTTIQWLLLGCETSILQFVEENFETYYIFALTVLEFLINLLGELDSDIHSKQAQGSKLNETKYQKNKIELKIERWLSFFNRNSHFCTDKYFIVCFLWLKYCFMQYTTHNIDHKLIQELTNIESLCQDLPSNFSIPYNNYRYIPSLKLSIIKSQLNKVNIIQKITDINDEQYPDQEHNYYLNILENALIETSAGISYPDVDPQKTDNKVDEIKNDVENKDIRDFINNAPILMRVKLWEILFSSYLKNKDEKKVLACYFQICNLILDSLFSQQYCHKDETSRYDLLLECMGIIGSYSSKIVKFIQQNKWEISNLQSTSHEYNQMLRIFFLYYIVIYFESNPLNASAHKSFFKRAVKSSAKMKARMCDIAIVLVLCFDQTIQSDAEELPHMVTVNMISLFHTLFGSFRFCDSSGGHFLLFSERFVSHFINNDAFIQLNQISWCKYHFNVIGDSPLVEQHHTKEVEMEEENAIPLGMYLTKYYSKDKNLLLHAGNKTGLKHILEKVIDTMGNLIGKHDFVIERNVYMLEEYLNGPISSKIFTMAKEGNGSPLYLLKPMDGFQEVVETGVFYFSGIQALNFYKTRKKSMQARPSELDAIIRSLKTDIIYNTQRFESWYLLGCCYSLIIEDDLLWTAEKITSPEKKKNAALTQRKAILCYLASLCYYRKKSEITDDDKIIGSKLLESLGAELIGGYLKPMAKECFKIYPPVDPVNTDNENVQKQQNFEFSLPINDVKEIIINVFDEAIHLLEETKTEEERSRWKPYYRLGKSIFKFKEGKNKLLAIKSIHVACNLAAISSTSKDIVLEPQYALVNMCYKLLKNGEISANECLQIILENNNFFVQPEEFWQVDTSVTEYYQNKEAYSKIIILLRYILSQDKKKWQHRPKYRIARILYDDFGAVDQALSELFSYVSLKSVNKNLVNIWKPDFERPGKHFVYTYQYVVMCASLLFEKGDFNSLGKMCKKIRRFGSSMADASTAMEIILDLYMRSITINLHFDDKQYSDYLMANLIYPEFVKISSDLQKTLNKYDYELEILESIIVAYQLKKGHNGITFDTICLSLYFKFFYLPHAAKMKDEAVIDHDTQHNAPSVEVGEQSTVSTESQSNNINANPIFKKRVSKKETFDVIKALVSKIT